ncbi:fused diaminohydroxyphosphoribosylaminopyrimidine deaminase; 5-amino-6-(5-phosphoribosylamino) uracil reductase [Clostridiaceae bacterium BL-3]|jgi:diaminohydroxyphosphoribosylaminopyrimidine deaminase/5-amino-6-(5-phosphoribosylamino)uracil reductase|nr:MULTISPECIES: bifunctional diaminohydroxyphosphoribosylaminopyrimidine deaminase/5-amino-6-(5-phosphoribosylamino)uracil reductase RibD [Clostridium]CAB1262780.1 fused diaminohydroxyphosphoribosylaminopyrimidine deaminase; 5-amino-6-(5-phosphoribosylamino) uracil reductase [Clostridiaceae bacterium BL-3]
MVLEDSKYMRYAIALARKGEGWVNPNPMVGAVVVKENRIIGEGYHEVCGKPHAERNALASCIESAKGATLYVTLEPCCHYGRTPPCTDAIIKAGITKVVVGSSDPNPKVSGKGISILRRAGIVVKEGVLKEKCDELNTVFFHYIVTGTPYVVMKYAMTADGKIATVTGDSKWVTGKAARKHVQQLRHKYSAIMVGIGTVLKDDPLLTCRLKNSRNPIRIICDSHLRIPMDSQICRTAKEVHTILATTVTDETKISKLKSLGITVLTVSGKDEMVNLPILMQKLGQLEIDSILLEGGSALNYSALKADLVQEVYAYIAPKIFGGKDAKTPVEGDGVLSPEQCFQFTAPEISVLDGDLMLRFKFVRRKV